MITTKPKKATGRVAYVNARLLDPASGLDAPGALLTEADRIIDLGPRLFADGVPEGIEVVDCGGLCLAPGLVDMRAHLREPGAEHKETLATASQAAAAGGVTTVVCMPNTDPVIDHPALIEFIARRARETSLVKIYPAAAITRGLAGADLTEIGLLKETGAVAFTDAHRAVSNSRVMARALSYSRAFDALIMQHPEDPDLAADGVMNDGELATRLGLLGIPAAAEPIIIERDLRLLRTTGGRYHVAHLSTGDSARLVACGKAEDLTVTAATAPHYFALNEAAVDDYRTFAKVSPPLRSEADRRAVVAGLVDGTIDVIASDHCPQDQDNKRLPFAQAEFGVVGLETLLPTALELVHNGTLSLLDLLDKLTRRPAELLGLDAGRLRQGAPADLVLFDPEAPGQVRVEDLKSLSKNTPFEGRLIQGKVLRTLVDGRTIYQP